MPILCINGWTDINVNVECNIRPCRAEGDIKEEAVLVFLKFLKT